MSWPSTASLRNNALLFVFSRGAMGRMLERSHQYAGSSHGGTRFQIFRGGRQCIPSGRETAAYFRSTRQGSKSWTSYPVDNVTGVQGIIWVDAVGGFLVVASDTIRIGQALAGNDIELPIVGDISRQHAVIQRSGEDYLLTPHSRTSVAGRVVGGLTRLSDGDEIEMNNTVQLRFRKPHPLSNSARLDFLSHHKTSPPVDGVLLVGENVLLGPDPNCHVVCRNWQHTLALQTQVTEESHGFRFQTAEAVQVNESAATNSGCIKWGERLTGENFALVMERL